MDLGGLLKLLAAPFGLGAGAVFAVIAAQWVIKRLGAAGDGYASRKGENLATKEDLKDFIDQLRAIETTKAGIAHEDWTAREWRAARMKNLESFVTSAVTALSTYTQLMHDWRSGIQGNDDPSPVIKARTLQMLFYPEFEQALDGFLGPCIESRQAAKDFYYSQMALDPIDRNFDSPESWADHRNHAAQMLNGLNWLTAEVRELTCDIYKQDRTTP
jgi:hypothetical protein